MQSYSQKVKKTDLCFIVIFGNGVQTALSIVRNQRLKTCYERSSSVQVREMMRVCTCRDVGRMERRG